MATDHRDARGLGPRHLRRVVEAVGEGFASSQYGVGVEGLIADQFFHARHVSGGIEHLARPQERLAGHACPVRAFAADEFVFDNGGGAAAALYRVLRGILTDGSSADDDHIEFRALWGHCSTVT